MIILIDNYDSFSYNLYQLVGSASEDIEIKVIRNDAMTVEEIRDLKPEGIILSPGPGKPEDAGVCVQVAKELGKDIPILGVCLGHQAICTAFGGTVSYAKTLMHGKQSLTEVDKNCQLFRSLEDNIMVARYHSLALIEDTLPDELVITARADDNEVMAVQHKEYPIFGLQFHPESIMTPDGDVILKNFIEFTKETRK